VSDDFLSRFREEPRPELASGLKRRLDAIDNAAPAPGLRRGGFRAFRPVFVGALAMAAIVAVFTLPPVRAVAREFLDLFRVQRFAAVPVDHDRLARLAEGGVDLKTLVGDQIEVLEPAREPEPVDSAEVASAIAGIHVRQPTFIPENATFAGMAVAHPGAYRVRLDVSKLEELAEALGIDDVRIPAAWDGATVEVHAPPVVTQRFSRGENEFVLVQSLGPEVALPDGVELDELGALGLQMAGMSAEEARLFAARIDWRSTLLVPIPAEGGNFREVEVQGRKGLLVSGRSRPKPGPDGPRRGAWKAVLLWADDDQVYAALGPGHGMEVLQMAESIE
jgi:hypothetical protein